MAKRIRTHADWLQNPAPVSRHEQLSIQFMQDPTKRAAVERVADRLGIDPTHLAAVIARESGGNHQVWGGKGGNYYGLIQFGPPERQAYGVRMNMTFTEQLEGPVVRYFEDRFKKANVPLKGATLQQLYAAILTGTPKGNIHSSDGHTTVARSLRLLQDAAVRTAKLFGRAITDAVAFVDPLHIITPAPGHVEKAGKGKKPRVQTARLDKPEKPEKPQRSRHRQVVHAHPHGQPQPQRYAARRRNHPAHAQNWQPHRLYQIPGPQRDTYRGEYIGDITKLQRPKGKTAAAFALPPAYPV